jgi:hypothetical protein
MATSFASTREGILHPGLVNSADLFPWISIRRGSEPALASRDIQKYLRQ